MKIEDDGPLKRFWKKKFWVVIIIVAVLQIAIVLFSVFPNTFAKQVSKRKFGIKIPNTFQETYSYSKGGLETGESGYKYDKLVQFAVYEFSKYDDFIGKYGFTDESNPVTEEYVSDILFCEDSIFYSDDNMEYFIDFTKAHYSLTKNLLNVSETEEMLPFISNWIAYYVIPEDERLYVVYQHID